MEDKVTPIQNDRQNYSSVYLNLYIFWIANWQTKDFKPDRGRQCEFSLILINVRVLINSGNRLSTILVYRVLSFFLLRR